MKPDWTSQTVKVFYHDDNDGVCSAAIVNMYLKVKENMISGKGFHKIDYIEEYLHHIDEGDFVILVDFTPKNDEWDNILSKTSNIIWIDHHSYPVKTAEEYLEKLGVLGAILGRRHHIKAACELTWEFFFNSSDPPFLNDKRLLDMPNVVRYLGDYDAWIFKYADKTWFTEYGIQSMGLHPGSSEWQVLLRLKHPCLLDEILNKGKIVKSFLEFHYEKLMKNIAFFIEFEGISAVACNSHEGTSELFKSITRDYDLMIIFVMKKNGYKVSLRTRKGHVNCGRIARKYGGNGHDQSAGFFCKELPFKQEK